MIMFGRPRRLALASAIGALALANLAQIGFQVFGPYGPFGGQGCSVEFFGVMMGSSGTCYLPMTPQLVFTIALFVAAAAALKAPVLAGRVAAALALLLAFDLIKAIFASHASFDLEAIELCLVTAIPILFLPARGPAASRLGRSIWISLLVVTLLLFLVDMTVLSPGSPQLSFGLVLLAVLVAGNVSGRLAASERANTAVTTEDQTAPA